MDVYARNRSSAVVSNEKQRQTPKMNCTTVDPRPVSVQSTAYYNFVPLLCLISVVFLGTGIMSYLHGLMSNF